MSKNKAFQVIGKSLQWVRSFINLKRGVLPGAVPISDPYSTDKDRILYLQSKAMQWNVNRDPKDTQKLGRELQSREILERLYEGQEFEKRDRNAYPDYYFAALQTYMLSNDKVLITMAQWDMAETYFKTNMPGHALGNYIAALENLKKLENRSSFALLELCILSKISTLEVKIGDTNASFKYFQMALEVMKKIDDSALEAATKFDYLDLLHSLDELKHLIVEFSNVGGIEQAKICLQNVGAFTTFFMHANMFRHSKGQPSMYEKVIKEISELSDTISQNIESKLEAHTLDNVIAYAGLTYYDQNDEQQTHIDNGLGYGAYSILDTGLSINGAIVHIIDSILWFPKSEATDEERQIIANQWLDFAQSAGSFVIPFGCSMPEMPKPSYDDDDAPWGSMGEGLMGDKEPSFGGLLGDGTKNISKAQLVQ